MANYSHKLVVRGRRKGGDWSPKAKDARRPQGICFGWQPKATPAADCRPVLRFSLGAGERLVAYAPLGAH